MNLQEFLRRHSNAQFIGPHLDSPFVAILNSRQSKTPVGSNNWVRNTVLAVKKAVERGSTILSSTGMNTYELVLWATGYSGGKQIIVSRFDPNNPPGILAGKIIRDFRLKPEDTAFLFFTSSAPPSKPKLAWAERDNIVCELADIIYPISIRTGGSLERLIKMNTARGCSIINEFTVPYAIPKRTPLQPLDTTRLETIIRATSWNYITHFTHTFSGPWQDELPYNYYRDIVESGEEYPRSAFATLKRIVIEQKIIPSVSHMRNKIPAISFTSLLPTEATKLMRWRKSYVRYTFEPYGIAIDKEIALQAGIRPVIYGDEMTYKLLPEDEKPYFQPRGTIGEWTRESEWRFIGTLYLSKIPREKMLVIVKTEAEALELRRLTNIPIISFT